MNITGLNKIDEFLFKGAYIVERKPSAVEVEQGKWLPQVKVILKDKEGKRHVVPVLWEKRIFDTKEKARNDANHNGKMWIKQNYAKAVKGELI